MTEIYENLYVGSDEDFKSITDLEDWYIIHACKEPYHRQLLGYTGRSCDSNHPEYLYAERDDALYLNMVDATNEKYIPNKIMIKAISTIHDKLNAGKKVLVHCNKGESRSPSICLLYLKYINYFYDFSYDKAKELFRGMYPRYSPNSGVDNWLRNHWVSENDF